MKYWYQKPHHLLSEYIRTVLVLEGFSQSESDKLPLFTNGMPALVCRTERELNGNENIQQLTLFGKSTPPGYWSINDDTTVIAYFFNPFSMACLFDIDAAKLVKAPIDLRNWSAHKTNALRTQLIYATSTSRKTEILDNLLVQQLEQNKKQCEIIKYATDKIMLDNNTDVLSNIQTELKLTERTFQRIFKKYVGITPNQYRRICQFEGSFAQLRTKEFDKLTDVAYDNGFADQSHFIRSFKEFTRVSPGDYLKSGLKGGD